MHLSECRQLNMVHFEFFSCNFSRIIPVLNGTLFDPEGGTSYRSKHQTGRNIIIIVCNLFMKIEEDIVFLTS